MKILAFAATSSSTSINKALVSYAANLVTDAEIEIIDLNDFELPIFNTDIEKELGVPALAQLFYDKIGQADAVFISFAEHNGNFTAAYKNIFDWASRINKKVFQDKPMVFLAAAPGPGGGRNVLNIAVSSAPHFAGQVKASYSLSHFHQKFDLVNHKFIDIEAKAKLEKIIQEFVQSFQTAELV